MVSSKIIFALGFLAIIASVSAFPTVTKSEDEAVTTVRSSVNEEVAQDSAATTELLSDDVTTVSPAANDEVEVVVLDNVENIVVVPVEKKNGVAVSNAGEKLEVVPAQKTVTSVSSNVEKVVVEPVAIKSEVESTVVPVASSSVAPEVSSVVPEVSSVAPEKKTEAVESKTSIVVSSRSKRSPQHSWLMNIFRRGHPQRRRGRPIVNQNRRTSDETYESIQNNMYYGQHNIEPENRYGYLSYGAYGGSIGYED